MGKLAHGQHRRQPTTLEAAIARAATGDANHLRGGTYRTRRPSVQPGITLQPHGDEQPVIKGTQVATKWEAQGNGICACTAWPRLFPAKPADWWRRHREGRKTPLYSFNNDMVFVDGSAAESRRWGGANTNAATSVLHDYEAGQHLPRRRPPRTGSWRSRRSNHALLRTTARVHDKDSDRRGPDDPRAHVHAVCVSRYRDRRSRSDGVSAGIGTRQGCRRKHARARDDLSHCSRVAAYLRGEQPSPFGIAGQRHEQPRGFSSSARRMCCSDRTFSPQQRRADHRLLPGPRSKSSTSAIASRVGDNLVIDQPHSNGIW